MELALKPYTALPDAKIIKQFDDLTLEEFTGTNGKKQLAVSEITFL